jgi:hypothetical protein
MHPESEPLPLNLMALADARTLEILEEKMSDPNVSREDVLQRLQQLLLERQ